MELWPSEYLGNLQAEAARGHMDGHPSSQRTKWGREIKVGAVSTQVVRKGLDTRAISKGSSMETERSPKPCPESQRKA